MLEGAIAYGVDACSSNPGYMWTALQCGRRSTKHRNRFAVTAVPLYTPRDVKASLHQARAKLFALRKVNAEHAALNDSPAAKARDSPSYHPSESTSFRVIFLLAFVFSHMRT